MYRFNLFHVVHYSPLLHSRRPTHTHILFNFMYTAYVPFLHNIFYSSLVAVIWYLKENIVRTPSGPRRKNVDFGSKSTLFSRYVPTRMCCAAFLTFFVVFRIPTADHTSYLHQQEHVTRASRQKRAKYQNPRVPYRVSRPHNASRLTS